MGIEFTDRIEGMRLYVRLKGYISSNISDDDKFKSDHDKFKSIIENFYSHGEHNITCDFNELSGIDSKVLSYTKDLINQSKKLGGVFEIVCEKDYFDLTGLSKLTNSYKDEADFFERKKNYPVKYISRH